MGSPSERRLPTIMEGPVSFSIVIPEGAVPGSTLQHTTPDGKQLDLTVPAGVPAGSHLTLTQDPATGSWSCTVEVEPATSHRSAASTQRSAAPNSFSLTVPADAKPGSTLVHRTPDGRELDIVVPDGVPPGYVLTMTQDPATRAWHCSAEPPAAQWPPVVAEKAPVRTSVMVPYGATPGSTLQCQTPDGRQLDLTVPEGVPGGSYLVLTQDPATGSWSCTVEAAPADVPEVANASPARVSMVVPADAKPGSTLQFKLPDGRELDLTVPEGVPPGSTLALVQDPVTLSWSCTVESLGPSGGWSSPSSPAARAGLPQQEDDAFGNMGADFEAPPDAPPDVMPSTSQPAVDVSGIRAWGLAGPQSPTAKSSSSAGRGSPERLPVLQSPVGRPIARGPPAPPSPSPTPPFTFGDKADEQDGGMATVLNVGRFGTNGLRQSTGGTVGADASGVPPPGDAPADKEGDVDNFGDLSVNRVPVNRPPSLMEASGMYPQGGGSMERTAVVPVGLGLSLEPPQALPGVVDGPPPPPPAPGTVWYCDAHGTSEKRPKNDVGRIWECLGCKAEINTNYKHFAYCQPCSDQQRRCMVCGDEAKIFSSQMATRPRGPPPFQASSVPPRYCQLHDTSEKRSKTSPKFWDCKGCGRQVTTTYVDFTLCPPCSERDMRCMICGAAALEAGRYMPPSTLQQGQGGEQGATSLDATPPPPPPGASAYFPPPRAGDWAPPPYAQPWAPVDQPPSYVPPPAQEQKLSFVPVPEQNRSYIPLPTMEQGVPQQLGAMEESFHAQRPMPPGMPGGSPHHHMGHPGGAMPGPEHGRPGPPPPQPGMPLQQPGWPGFMSSFGSSPFAAPGPGQPPQNPFGPPAPMGELPWGRGPGAEGCSISTRPGPEWNPHMQPGGPLPTQGPMPFLPGPAMGPQPGPHFGQGPLGPGMGQSPLAHSPMAGGMGQNPVLHGAMPPQLGFNPFGQMPKPHMPNLFGGGSLAAPPPQGGFFGMAQGRPGTVYGHPD